MVEIREEIKSVLTKAQAELEDDPDKSYWSFLFADKIAERSKHFAKEFEGRNIIWIGIGGSSSGPRAIFRFFDIKAVFLESPEDKLEKITKDDIVYVVSKSGTTYETLYLFKDVLKRMIKKKLNPSRHVVAVSQEGDSPLMELCKKFQIRNIPFPSNLSGRFSTFFISYFPLAAADPAVLRRTLIGLERIRSKLHDENSLHFKLSEFLLRNTDKQDLFICFYSRKLFEFSENISQLLAESLGKDGKGFSPIAVLGPHFQHSIAQLVLANPYSKFAIFLTPRGKRYVEVQKESNATYSVFSEKLPAMKIEYYEKPEEISGLLFSFQIAVAVCGTIMGVNPFDQPEVKKIRDILEES